MGWILFITKKEEKTRVVLIMLNKKRVVFYQYDENHPIKIN